MEDSSKKRKADADQKPSASNKKAKGKKKWTVPRKSVIADDISQAYNIEPGDAGVWATCDRNRERRCVLELRGTFEEYAKKLYGISHEDAGSQKGDAEKDEADIEAEIQKELQDIRKPAVKAHFTNIRLDTQCLVFFKTRPPIEPAPFVHAICTDAANSAERKQSRFVKRLTPITMTGKATEKDIEQMAPQVLAPHFHGAATLEKKFAIRTSIRNHTVLTRDRVIKIVAAAVGPGHSVDLTNYDLLILVEIYKNVCGMSVVRNDYERLKRYNLSEINKPTAKPEEL
ncbi:hypothetical protein K432DRAFT_289061 [Lepidopterella palustris CBS 459.81]|uniref:THUMP domain-containing protein n=1 Tax=Lepidopterella palustris CBS 459.81 TaxID=1314670 RepID=A0A8E2EIH1_9PEZI|nr:hypothetical protein K432DRAFT_289061 [Lepidopterella palustris CBS 459.81]